MRWILLESVKLCSGFNWNLWKHAADFIGICKIVQLILLEFVKEPNRQRLLEILNNLRKMFVSFSKNKFFQVVINYEILKLQYYKYFLIE